MFDEVVPQSTEPLVHAAEGHTRHLTSHHRPAPVSRAKEVPPVEYCTHRAASKIVVVGKNNHIISLKGKNNQVEKRLKIIN